MAKLKVSNPLEMGGNPPNEPVFTMEQAASDLYGSLDLPTTNRIIARPVALTGIKPDVKQPRRIIPAVIRKGWTGDVARIPDMLREWRATAERALGEPIHTEKLLDKFGDGREADKEIAPIVEEYLALCALAASIKRDGLANPIQVTRANVIVTGERRYMAHWLLNTWLGGFDSIPAQVVGEADVWLQAAENGARKPLNAIGMARQLALLIMEMYVGDDGVKFDDITFFNHEREFYAQVSNGNIWRIKKGFGERVLQVTGLKSISQVQQYRALLSIPNDLWDEADTNSYAEFRIREMVKPRDTEKVNGVYTSTTVDVSAQNGGQAQAEFYRMLGGVLSDIRNGKGETGLYLVLGGYHVFVWYHHAKRCYEMLRWSGDDVHVRDLVDAKAALGVMYEISPTTGRWRVANKSEFDKATRPNYGAGWSGQMVAPNDDRRTKQRQRFDELMRPVLDYQMLYYSERGMYCNIAHTFVIWNPKKNGFEAYNNGHLNMLYQLDDALVVMFSTCPDFNTWKAMHKSDYDKLVKSKHQKPTPTLSVDMDAVMHDMGIGDDDEYLDEDVRHPFGNRMNDDDDMTDEVREILAREIAMIDNDFAEYNAQQKAQTSAPPKDFNHPLVFDKSSPEYLLAYAVMVAMESTGKDKARHVALMLTKITGHEIANWHGEWSDVVGEWHMEFSEAVGDMVNAMFNRLDDLGSKP